MGLLPNDVYHMTLAEINLYVYEANNERIINNISLAWKIANFVGLLLSGKLKDLKDYLPKQTNNNKKNNCSFREKLVLEAKDLAKNLGHKI